MADKTATRLVNWSRRWALFQAVLIAVLAIAAFRTWRTSNNHKEGAAPLVNSQPHVSAMTTAPGGDPRHDHTNRLAGENSPYLLQHAHNPVDWYPWGEEAFAKAVAEDKPIFLSIGYATCHWCHVMERESFESEEIAALLNRWFVCIKVDREERPDIDEVYMAAVQLHSGQGGWPMSVFLTPTAKPFFGGTYYPPESRFGRPGFRALVIKIAELWQSQRATLLDNADTLIQQLNDLAKATSKGKVDGQTINSAFSSFEASFDAKRGGFGHAPKFPRSPSLSFLLRFATDQERSSQALAMVTTTLDAIRRGGVHDHIGGGFHRYSTDADWLVPHFEKMLYDQALLAYTFVEAHLATGEPRYAEAARDIFGYVQRDLTSPTGGFYCAEDADSEGVEGRFYVWTLAQLTAVLGADDAEVFAAVYGCSEAGNYRDEVTGERSGTNIVHLTEDFAAHARRLDVSETALASSLAQQRTKLLAARSKRVRPLRDDKILTDWNGLMIWALARGARALDDRDLLATAEGAARFCLTRMRREDGRLFHRYHQNNVGVSGLLDDYAMLALGLLELHQASLELEYLVHATQVTDNMVRLFFDEERGSFTMRGKDSKPLIVTPRSAYDGAVPSGNSVAAYVLIRLGRLLGNPRYEKLGNQVLEGFASSINRHPSGHPFMLMAAQLATSVGSEIILTGPPMSETLAAMRREVEDRYLPHAVLLYRPGGKEGAVLEAMAPFVEDIDGSAKVATAYVCTNRTCQQPVTTATALAKQLQGK